MRERERECVCVCVCVCVYIRVRSGSSGCTHHITEHYAFVLHCVLCYFRLLFDSSSFCYALSILLFFGLGVCFFPYSLVSVCFLLLLSLTHCNVPRYIETPYLKLRLTQAY